MARAFDRAGRGAPTCGVGTIDLLWNLRGFCGRVRQLVFEKSPRAAHGLSKLFKLSKARFQKRVFSFL